MNGFSMVPAPGCRILFDRTRRERTEVRIPFDVECKRDLRDHVVYSKEAKLGNYTVVLREKSDPKQKGAVRRRGPGEQASGRFRVEEFPGSPCQGNDPAACTALIRAKEVALDLNVQYLAGEGEPSPCQTAKRGRAENDLSLRGIRAVSFRERPGERRDRSKGRGLGV